MLKDLNYYMDLLKKDEKVFREKLDISKFDLSKGIDTAFDDGRTWEVFYKRLPNIFGEGSTALEAEKDLVNKSRNWVEHELANGFLLNGIDLIKEEPKPVTAKPCPFCGGKNITFGIAGCEGYAGCADCDYEFSVGDVDFDRKMSVENQARKLWNGMRPIESALKDKITELKSRIDELEGKNGI